MNYQLETNIVHITGCGIGAAFIAHELSSKAIGIFSTWFIATGAAIYAVIFLLALGGILFKRAVLLEIVDQLYGTVATLFLVGFFFDLSFILNSLFCLLCGIVLVGMLIFFLKGNYQALLKYREKV